MSTTAESPVASRGRSSTQMGDTRPISLLVCSWRRVLASRRFDGGRVVGSVLGVRLAARPLDSEDGQYHLPRAKPPKPTSPISVTANPIQKLQTMIRMIPTTITRIPPIDTPPNSAVSDLPFSPLRLLSLAQPAVGQRPASSRSPRSSDRHPVPARIGQLPLG